VAQLSDLMGRDTALALQAMIESAARPHEGMVASIVGIVVLIVATRACSGRSRPR
jgi:hypothetical protein